MYKSPILFSFFLLVLFASCQKESTTTTTTPTMSVEIDGTAQTATNFNNTLIKVQQNGEDGRRLDLRANIGSDMLIISVSNWDFQNPPTDGILTKVYDTNTTAYGGLGPNKSCTTRPAGNLCDSGLGTYTIGSATWMSENMPNEPRGTITITANDDANKTVSGTFDFKVVEVSNPNNTPKHFTGSFSNMSYTVIN